MSTLDRTLKLRNLNVQTLHKTNLLAAKNCTDNKIIQKVVDKDQANVFDMFFFVILISLSTVINLE